MFPLGLLRRIPVVIYWGSQFSTTNIPTNTTLKSNYTLACFPQDVSLGTKNYSKNRVCMTVPLNGAMKAGIKL